MDKKTTGENKANNLLAAALAVALLAITAGSQPVAAAETAATGKVQLVATLKDGPAMQAVSWKVLKGTDVVEKTRSHSITYDLPTGSYTARLECNGKQRDSSFSVTKGGNTRVVMACD